MKIIKWCSIINVIVIGGVLVAMANPQSFLIRILLCIPFGIFVFIILVATEEKK